MSNITDKVRRYAEAQSDVFDDESAKPPQALRDLLGQTVTTAEATCVGTIFGAMIGRGADPGAVKEYASWVVDQIVRMGEAAIAAGIAEPPRPTEPVEPS